MLFTDLSHDSPILRIIYYLNTRRAADVLSRCSLPCLNSTLRNLPRFASTSSVTPSDAKVSKSEVAVHQAPNYPTTWSTSQLPCPGLHSGPRFEQTDMSLQPNPLSALELIAQEPIRLVKERKAACDGGWLQVSFYCATFSETTIQEVDLLGTLRFTSTWYVDLNLKRFSRNTVIPLMSSSPLAGSTRLSRLWVSWLFLIPPGAWERLAAW